MFLWALCFKLMKSIFKLITLLFLTQLHAQVLISPVDAMQESYGVDAKISKKNILLTKSKFSNVQKSAKVKLNTKIYRIFTASKDENILGYGILINRKVRSKNAVVLYLIQNDTLLSIEIVAFNEPLEYLPTQKWNKQFEGIKTDKMLQLNRDIPSISGATLSARTVTDGSKVAFAIYHELLKD